MLTDIEETFLKWHEHSLIRGYKLEFNGQDMPPTIWRHKLGKLQAVNYLCKHMAYAFLALFKTSKTRVNVSIDWYGPFYL